MARPDLTGSGAPDPKVTMPVQLSRCERSGWMPDVERAGEESSLPPSVLETAASTTGSSPNREAFHTGSAIKARNAEWGRKTRELSEEAELPTSEAHAGIGGFRPAWLIPMRESAQCRAQIRAEARQGCALGLFLGVGYPCHRKSYCMDRRRDVKRQLQHFSGSLRRPVTPIAFPRPCS